MPYLITRYPVHENLLQIFFSNVVLENTSEESENPYRIMAINTFMMGMPIWITQGVVAQVFGLSDDGVNSEHKGYLSNMIVPNDNTPFLLFHERLLHFFITHFFQSIGLKHTIIRYSDY